MFWQWFSMVFTFMCLLLDMGLPGQRWKNIRACKQCLCKIFHSFGKICEKIFAVLRQTGVFFFFSFVLFWVMHFAFNLVNFKLLLSKRGKTNL